MALACSDRLTGTRVLPPAPFLGVAAGVVPPPLGVLGGELTAGALAGFGVIAGRGIFGVLRGIAGLIVVGEPIGGTLGVETGGTGVAGCAGVGETGTAASARAGLVEERECDLCSAAYPAVAAPATSTASAPRTA